MTGSLSAIRAARLAFEEGVLLLEELAKELRQGIQHDQPSTTFDQRGQPVVTDERPRRLDALAKTYELEIARLPAAFQARVPRNWPWAYGQLPANGASRITTEYWIMREPPQDFDREFLAPMRAVNKRVGEKLRDIERELDAQVRTTEQQGKRPPPKEVKGRGRTPRFDKQLQMEVLELWERKQFNNYGDFASHLSTLPKYRSLIRDPVKRKEGTFSPSDVDKILENARKFRRKEARDD